MVSVAADKFHCRLFALSSENLEIDLTPMPAAGVRQIGKFTNEFVMDVRQKYLERCEYSALVYERLLNLTPKE